MHNILDLPSDIASQVTSALREDIGDGDITAQLIPEHTQASATIFCREDAVLCGAPWAEEVIRQLDAGIRFEWHCTEGAEVLKDQALITMQGDARALLTAERSILNFLQSLSGTATLAKRYANAVAHTQVKLLDTRKTIPGLRTAQKYAVRIGGCHNHRMGLYDAFLIKENHINACGSISAAVNKAHQLHPSKPVEVEVENLQQLEEAINAQANTIMLDNFTLDDLDKAVKITNGKVKLEASGGINNETLVPIAQSGVDFISIGALTKDCKAIDLSMLFN